MQPGFVKFTHNRAGYVGVMRSPGMVADMQSRVDRVAAAARSALTDPDIYLLADTTLSRTRAGGTVIGVPMRIEAADRVLGRALDAAG